MIYTKSSIKFNPLLLNSPVDESVIFLFDHSINTMCQNKLKVSFICWDAYPAYVPSFKAPMGGAEFRSSLIAKQLAKNGQFEVSALVYESLAVRQVTADGVHVVPFSDKLDFLEKNLMVAGMMVQRISRFPWIKLNKPRLSLLWRLPLAVPYQVYKYQFDTNRRPAKYRRKYARLQSDIFLYFCTSNKNADLIISSHKMNRKSILMLANDADLHERYMLPSDEPPGYGESVVAWNQALMTADVIVAQTEYQQRILKDRFERDSFLVHNPIDLERRLETRYPNTPDRYVLWIGRSDVRKRPELCLELARMNPEIPFVMVMNNINSLIYESIISQATSNVTMIEQVPVDQIESLFCHAAIYLSTSRIEGFPNTFLQAAKYQVPIASLTVDPNHMLTIHGGGVWAQDNLQTLSEAIEEMWHDNGYRKSLGDKALTYVKTHHDLRKIIDQIQSIITELADR